MDAVSLFSSRKAAVLVLRDSYTFKSELNLEYFWVMKRNTNSIEVRIAPGYARKSPILAVYLSLYVDVKGEFQNSNSTRKSS